MILYESFANPDEKQLPHILENHLTKLNDFHNLKPLFECEISKMEM